MPAPCCACSSTASSQSGTQATPRCRKQVSCFIWGSFPSHKGTLMNCPSAPPITKAAANSCHEPGHIAHHTGRKGRTHVHHVRINDRAGQPRGSDRACSAVWHRVQPWAFSAHGLAYWLSQPPAESRRATACAGAHRKWRACTTQCTPRTHSMCSFCACVWRVCSEGTYMWGINMRVHRMHAAGA